MNISLYFVILIAAFCAAIYLLYCQGIAVTKSIVAILFVFRPARSADIAVTGSGTGWVRHVGRFYESRTYEFCFNAQLSKGSVEVILLDKEKQPLMKLNQQSPRGQIYLDAQNRYYLRWEFKRATGKCELCW